jgi:type IV secretory pathway VirD2 relaxase
MASEDDFEPKLGRMRAQAPKAPKSHRARVMHAAQRHGGFKTLLSGSRGMPSNFGRGAGVARVMSGAAAKGPRARRVVVKARFIRLAGKGARAAIAHLKYLQRGGVTRDGQKGELYGPENDRSSASDFMERCEGDRHQFRFIVAPEDSLQYEDMKPLIRKVMAQMETDLGTKLDWVAVDHFNTGHPHSHIVVRGRDDQGKDLVIARDYLSEGLRERVQAQVTLDLGPRSDREITAGLQAEVAQERITSFDRQFRREASEDGRLLAGHSNPVLSALRAGRLVKLEGLGLARNLGDGTWQLSPSLEDTLRDLSERGDIIKTLHRALKEKGVEAALADSGVHIADPVLGDRRQPLTGRLVERGLSDELGDRHYLILEGTDGRAHYVDIGHGEQTTALPDKAIIRVTPRVPEIKAIDRTITEVAAANGGHYSVDLHLRHDRSARQSFAETHARRLEAIRKANGGLDRTPDGRFRVGPDYLAKALDYEQKVARRQPVTVEVLSDRSLKAQTRHPGVTWLDRELTGGRGDGYASSGFGGEARAALRLRQQWLIEEGLMAAPGLGPNNPPPNLLATLHQRELRAVADDLQTMTGKTWRNVRSGEIVEGQLRQSVTLGSGKFAVVERAKDFALVPWRPVLDKHIGKTISGIVRDSGINWSIGRAQGRDFE